MLAGAPGPATPAPRPASPPRPRRRSPARPAAAAACGTGPPCRRSPARWRRCGRAPAPAARSRGCARRRCSPGLRVRAPRCRCRGCRGSAARSRIAAPGARRSRRCASSVVTTEKPVASSEAAWKAASAMPITGPRASSRAACRPGSPKQAMMCACAPAASPERTCSATPAAAHTSSWWPSIDGAPKLGCTASITVPGAAAARAACADQRGHRRGGVGVDHAQLHGRFLRKWPILYTKRRAGSSITASATPVVVPD